MAAGEAACRGGREARRRPRGGGNGQIRPRATGSGGSRPDLAKEGATANSLGGSYVHLRERELRERDDGRRRTKGGRGSRLALVDGEDGA